MQNNIKLIFSNLYSTTVFLNSISALIHCGLRKHSADGQGESGQYKNEPATERDCCHGRFIVSMADTGGNADTAYSVTSGAGPLALVSNTPLYSPVRALRKLSTFLLSSADIVRPTWKRAILSIASDRDITLPS